MKNGNLTCSCCGAMLERDNIHEFEGQMYCEDCLNEKTVVCMNCNERIWREDVEGDSNHILCRHCYDYHYTNCEDCGRLIHNDSVYYEDDDSDYPYCYDCYQKLMIGAIKNYSYKPEPLFFGLGNLFFGIELEIDKGGEYNDNAQAIIEVANNAGEHIYCKHDGSIDDGFEIVSHPMSLEYHQDKMNWEEVFDKAISMGYRSHQTCTCGLHLHVNRDAFGKTYEEQEAAIGRIVFFVEKHWNEIVKFSRRTSENLNRWAARYATISATSEETYKKAKDRNMGRYVAVNLENCNTVEFRLFRGTLNYNTFLATLQLVDEICFHAIHMADLEIENMSWSDFVMRILPKKAELIAYLKNKRLYVNEIEAETEEM